ncbi:MAG: T9SS type A sorting domain-containing protein [Chitinophagaceae bacterium]|nr:MAG: T9SS type A sorting domain-containing protein [Chitinophagaceae bacterium]
MNKIFYILILLIGINFTSFAQNKTSASDDNLPAKLINFYPNPASSTITFEFVKGYDRSYSLEVYNFMGKKVYEVKRTPSRISINLDDFFRGVYIFQLRDKNAAIVQSGKFQVVK